MQKHNAVKAMVDTLEEFEFDSSCSKDIQQRTVLHYAVLAKNNQMITHFTPTTQDVLSKDVNGLSSLDIALLTGNIDGVKVITTEINWSRYSIGDKVRAMKCACFSGDYMAIDYLIQEHKFNVITKDPADNSSILHWAVASPTLELTHLMHIPEVMMIINEPDKSRRTPLHLAARQDTARAAELCELLLENGADPLAIDSKKLNAFHYASTADGSSLRKLLEKTEGNIVTPKFGQLENRFVKMSCLHISAIRGRAESLEILITQIGKEFDPNILDKFKVCILYEFDCSHLTFLFNQNTPLYYCTKTGLKDSFLLIITRTKELGLTYDIAKVCQNHQIKVNTSILKYY